MPYTVTLETVPPAFAAVGRITCPVSELPKHLPPLCGQAWNFLRAHNIPSDGHMIAIYRGSDLSALQVQAGARVLAPFPPSINFPAADSPAITCVPIPSGTAAMTTHIGPYHQLKAAHDALVAWCQTHHHPRTGIVWELYDHPTPDPATTRTWVYHQLA